MYGFPLQLIDNDVLHETRTQGLSFFFFTYEWPMETLSFSAEIPNNFLDVWDRLNEILHATYARTTVCTTPDTKK